MRNLFIPGNIPGLKNNKQIVRKRLINGPKIVQYFKDTASYWDQYAAEFKAAYSECDKPIVVLFHIVRKSRHRWDFDNTCNTIQDKLSEHGWVEDDSANHMFVAPLPIDGKLWSYDPENPGVYIQLLSCKEYISAIAPYLP